MDYNSCVLLAGAIIKQALQDRQFLLKGGIIPGCSLHQIDVFFASELFEYLARGAADYIRDHLEEVI